MDPFATVEDYVSRYGDVEDEEILLEVLMDATRAIAAMLDREDIDYSDPDEDYAGRLMQVCRSMAYRAMGDDGIEMPLGATSFNQSAGSYSESYSLANPFGEIYLTKAERRLLGLDMPKVGVASPWHGGWS